MDQNSLVLSCLNEAHRLGVQDEYVAYLDENSPRMALMLASRQCPATRGTNSEFDRKGRKQMSHAGEEHITRITNIAKAAGINTHGKTYEGQLGTYADPDAWISSTSDVRHVAKKKGLAVTGDVEVDCTKRHKTTRLAPDIVKRICKEKRKHNPTLDAECRRSKKARAKLRHDVIAMHGKKKD